MTESLEKQVSRLVGYFQRLMQEHPNIEEWETGFTLATKFQKLILEESVSEQKFQTLFNLSESLPQKQVGSGWFELWLLMRSWGFELGFKVPVDHPWKVDTSKAVCIDVRGFNGQLNYYRLKAVGFRS